MIAPALAVAAALLCASCSGYVARSSVGRDAGPELTLHYVGGSNESGSFAELIRAINAATAATAARKGIPSVIDSLKR